MTGRAAPDAIFADPVLARIYDVFEDDRADLDAHADLVREFGAHSVLDIGCGTGTFAILLARSGTGVTGVDPAAASLEVARAKDVTAAVTWIHGDATTLPPLQVDLAVMTGNVAQVFLTDDDWLATLRGIHGALRGRGLLVFETRRPERRAFQDWASEAPVVREVPGFGQVEQRLEVTEVALPTVSFRYSYRFARDGRLLTSDSTLVFRTREQVQESLAAAGFAIRDVRDAPDRPGHEWVFIAERAR